LEDSGRFQVTVATSPQSAGDFSNFVPEFGKYQAVVFNYDGADWPANLRLQFEHYIENGGYGAGVNVGDTQKVIHFDAAKLERKCSPRRGKLTPGRA
jgi:hypothetical protein